MARMDEEGLRRIGEALARQAELRPEQFTRPVLKRLRQRAGK